MPTKLGSPSVNDVMTVDLKIAFKVLNTLGKSGDLELGHELILFEAAKSLAMLIVSREGK